MKKTILLIAILTAACVSLKIKAQVNAFMQKLPLLTEVALKSLETSLPPGIVREGSTRLAGQFNVLILSGNDQTRKKNAASYLAQKVNAFVYRIDLRLLVSKNARDTEKNIDLVFEEAKNKNCVLFFDEAEALFGKRTSVNSSHGRYDDEATDYFVRQLDKYRIPVIISATVVNNINPSLFEKFVRIHI